MQPIIIINWKMNINLIQAKFLSEIIQNNINVNQSVIIAPPTPYLAYLSNIFHSLRFCAQNVSALNYIGPYTGEYSAYIIKSCNINYAIIGHNEQRILHNEQDNTIKNKAINCLKYDITPIICIGESECIRKKNDYKNYLINQIINTIPSSNKIIIIAYEPIWAIGTNTIPSNEELSETIEFIKYILLKHQIAKKMYLVYGGSINVENIHNIMKIKNLDGVMIGKESLNQDKLIKILNFKG